MPEPAGDIRGQERRVDRRYLGGDFQSVAANATRRQAGKAEVDRPDCDGSLIDPHLRKLCLEKKRSSLRQLADFARFEVQKRLLFGR